MQTVVIGVGNPILGDDGVGIAVVRAVAKGLPPGSDTTITCREVCAGGLRLLEAMTGFHRAIIVDALITGRHPPGTVTEVPLADLGTTKNSACSHDATLGQALETARHLGLELPEEIRLLGIEAAEVDTFGETLSFPVAQAVPTARRQILRWIAGEGETPCTARP